MKRIGFLILLLVLSSVFTTFLNTPLGKAAVYNYYDWPTLQANSQRTGYTESSGPKDNQTYWRFQTGGPIMSSPVAVEGMVFFSSTDGYLYSVNGTTGKEVWATWIGSDVSSPSVALGKVFLTSKSGTAFAFNMNSGLQVWNKTFSSKSDSNAPLILGSRVFVSGNRTVCALNEAIGVWLSEKDFYHVSEINRLIYSDNMIIAVGSINSTLTRLMGFGPIRDSSGFSVSLNPSGNNSYSDFLTTEKATFFVSTLTSTNNSAMFGFNRMGFHLWERQLAGAIDALPANAYNTVYVATSNFVYALNSTDGSVQWSTPTSGAHSASSPAVADGKVYFGLDDGYIYALDALNGDLIWSYKTDGPVQSSPAISDGLLFIGSADGNLYAIGYPLIQNFGVGTWNKTAYQVNIQSSTAVTDVIFNPQLAQINFNITHQSGQDNFWNVTFKSDLLKGPYSVIADNAQLLAFQEQTNNSNTFLYFNSSRNISQLRIEGTDAIPEFPSFPPLLLAPMVILGAVVFVHKHRFFKNKKGRQDN